MSFFSKHRRGIVGTLLFHLGLLAILYLYGYTTPLPLPEEQGILVNFGDQETGSGYVEPSTNESSQPVYTPPVETRSDEGQTQAQPPESQPEPAEEEVMTQDFEEAPEVESGQTREEMEEEKRRQEQEEAERQAELERQRQAEAERKRREEQQRLEAERRRREEQQRQQQEAENMIQDAFSAGQNPRQNDATSEGEGTGPGNQGELSGSIETRNREGSNNTDGVSYSIAGRIPQNLPKPDYTYQIEGKVVVEVTVDKNGYVTNAVPGVKGSTTLDENLLREAKKAALKARFDRKPDAPAYQKGTITYYFKLN